MSNDSPMPAVQLSIVTTLYHSAEFISEFYQRVSRCASQHTQSWELIFVDDGSQDNSGDIAACLVKSDSRVTLVELSRNFGHHHAIMAGLSHATGQRVFLIDVDLEERPEWLTDFIRAFDESGADVVFGQQATRRDRLLTRVFSRLFYMTFNFCSEISIQAHACTVRLMSRAYVDALLTMRERSLFLGGNFCWAGFHQEPMLVEKTPRKTPSNYTPARKVSLLANAITSFSAYPLQMIFVVGLLMTLFSSVFGVVMITRRILDPESLLLGWSSVMVSLWFLTGIIIAFLGIIGLYLSKIYVEVKARPAYLVKSVYKSNDSGLAVPFKSRSFPATPHFPTASALTKAS